MTTCPSCCGGSSGGGRWRAERKYGQWRRRIQGVASNAWKAQSSLPNPVCRAGATTLPPHYPTCSITISLPPPLLRPLLCSFYSSAAADLTSLAEYVSRKKEGQNNIYYLAGEEQASTAAKQVAQCWPAQEAFLRHRVQLG